MGSHRAPYWALLLFIVSINDLYHAIAGHAIMYADDTSLFASHSDYHVSKIAVQELLNVASLWFKNNVLCLNEAKTQEITFSLSNDNKSDALVKLLGFTLDPQLNWKNHIELLCSKLSRVIFLLRRLKVDMPQQFVRLAFFAFFQSHIQYGTRLWGHSPAVQKVLLLQKKAVRVLCGAGQLEHCRPLLVQEGIMSVYNVYIYQCLLEVKKNEGDLLFNSNVHHHSTRGSTNVHRLRVRLDMSLNCFPVSGIRMFNHIPLAVRQSSTQDFASILKSWLLANPFYCINEFMDSATTIPVH